MKNGLRTGAEHLTGSTYRQRQWTVLEEKQLREMVELGVPARFIARSLHRAVTSVDTKARALRLPLVWE